MYLKQHFRNQPTPEFSITSASNLKSTWNPTKGSSSLELLLSQVEKDLFEVSQASLGNYNFFKEK